MQARHSSSPVPFGDFYPSSYSKPHHNIAPINRLYPYFPNQALLNRQALREQACLLLSEVSTELSEKSKWGSGAMSAAAYDTAWVARVRHPRDPANQLAFPQSFQWLLNNQASNGSWGGEESIIELNVYAIVPTLSGLLALLKAPPPYQTAQVRVAARKAEQYLRVRVANWELAGFESVGFEVLTPGLLLELKEFGICFDFPGEAKLLTYYQQKLSLSLPEFIYSGESNLLHSLEAFGPALNWQRLKPLQAANGSYGCSPAATAAALIYSQEEWDEQAAAWLTHLSEQAFDGTSGAMPNAYPIDAFEASWILYNLAQGFDLQQEFSAEVLGKILDWLEMSVTTAGASITRIAGIPNDSDDTGMVLAALHLAGRNTPVSSLDRFERDDYFACFEGERGKSVSANAHVLAAIGSLQFSDPGLANEPALRVHKLVKFLWQVREPQGFWTDKWHISPYYATACSVLAITAVETQWGDFGKTLNWLIATQALNGGWGTDFNTPARSSNISKVVTTLEETAYALQTLYALSEQPGLQSETAAIVEAIKRGMSYLYSEYQAETSFNSSQAENGPTSVNIFLPKLWRGKELYAPQRVVQAAILGALAR